MNIALENCEEVKEGRVTRVWGDAFVRGNNGNLSKSRELIGCVWSLMLDRNHN